MIITEEITVKDNKFEIMGETYDCSLAVKRDVEMIIDEAAKSHRDDFERLYDKDSIAPYKVRVFLDKADDKPLFGMVIYTIGYKLGNNSRTACGGYYPIYANTSRCLAPHPFQESICW